jgi:hypothetical protein
MLNSLKTTHFPILFIENKHSNTRISIDKMCYIVHFLPPRRLDLDRLRDDFFPDLAVFRDLDFDRLREVFLDLDRLREVFRALPSSDSKPLGFA